MCMNMISCVCVLVKLVVCVFVVGSVGSCHQYMLGQLHRMLGQPHDDRRFICCKSFVVVFAASFSVCVCVCVSFSICIHF
jgi:hypothetical protein